MTDYKFTFTSTGNLNGCDVIQDFIEVMQRMIFPNGKNDFSKWPVNYYA